MQTVKTNSKNIDQEQVIVFENLMGVDYSSNKLQVAKNRAIEISNLINDDGVNHKRPNWNEVCKIVNVYGVEERINGVYSYVDENKNIHTIIHASNKLYRIYKEDEETNGFDSNSIKTKYVDITPTNITINDDLSYGIVANDRLYLLCGSYIMYGKFDNEYKFIQVEDNAYIPTTTIGISAIGSTLDIKSTYEQANMMSKYRINKLVGEHFDSGYQDEIRLKKVLLNDDINGMVYFDTNIDLDNLIAHSTSNPLLKLINPIDVSFVNTTYILSELSPIKRIYVFYDYNDTWFEEGQEIWNEEEGWLIHSGLNFKGMVNTINQIDSQDLFYIQDTSSIVYKYNLDSKADNYNMVIEIDYGERVLNDTTYSGEVLKEYKIISHKAYLINQVENPSNNKLYGATKNIDGSFTLHGTPLGEIELNNTEYNTTQITLYNNYPPIIEGISNISVTFEVNNTTYKEQINQCTFGSLLNAQGGQYLFLSGNSNYSNMDWHSEYAIDDEIHSISDFTYIPYYSYSKFGSVNDTIIGYTVLGDDSMVIHTKSIEGINTLYKRNSTLNNNEILFPINKTAIGEGMISNKTSANLLGDNIYLSNHGVYGLVLDKNITSSERYALDRSGLINAQLKQEENLQNATAISYKGRYYLSINNKCYVADSRYKNYISTDMPDTFSYEWWVWDNIPARLFFIYNNELYFGTSQGQICKFQYDEFLSDKTYVKVSAITLSDIENSIFSIDETHENLINNLKDYDGIVIKKVVNDIEEDLLYIDGSDIRPLDFECPIMNYSNGDFQLLHYKDIEGNQIPYQIIANEYDTFNAYFILKHRVKSLYKFITNLDNPLYQKKIMYINITPEKISDGKCNIKIRSFERKEKEIAIDGINVLDFEHINFANFTFHTDDMLSSYSKKINVKCNYAEITIESDNDRDCIIYQLLLTYRYTKRNKGVK